MRIVSSSLVDAEIYEMEQKELKILEGIALGERDVLERRVRSHDEDKERLSKWLKRKSPEA